MGSMQKKCSLSGKSMVFALELHAYLHCSHVLEAVTFSPHACRNILRDIGEDRMDWLISRDESSCGFGKASNGIIRPKCVFVWGGTFFWGALLKESKRKPTNLGSPILTLRYILPLSLGSVKTGDVHLP